MIPGQVLFCPDCSIDQLFERPECGDGHGTECVELACTQCGAAVFIGSLAEELAEIIPVPARRAA